MESPSITAYITTLACASNYRSDRGKAAKYLRASCSDARGRRRSNDTLPVSPDYQARFELGAALLETPQTLVSRSAIRIQYA